MNYDVIAAKPDFRKSIIGLLIHTDWLSRFGTILIPDFFPTDEEKEFVKWVNWYHDTYKDAPSEEDAEHALPDSNLLEIYDINPTSLDYAADVALEFARVQAMKIAILESVEDIKEGDLQRPLDRIKKAQKVGSDRLDLGLDILEDVEDWVYDELMGKRIPTGWPILDNMLGGGFVVGEYGIVMAPPGRGKTTALINIGFAAAGMLGACNVLHISHEMPATKILKRYGARISGIRLSRGADTGGFIKRFRKAAKAKLRGSLRVKAIYGGTVADVRRTIDMLISEGFHPDLLIDDYPDLLVPTRKRNERRFELGDISRELRDLGSEYEMVVWGASQSGRQTFDKEVITERDIAESVEKVAIADVLLALCQTRDEARLGHGRIYLAKVRDAKSHVFIPVKVDMAKQSIIQRGK